MTQKKHQPELTIIVPSYNNEKWAERNLSTIFAQKYPHFRVIYINDASTDKTLNVVTSFTTQHKLQKKITIISNKKRMGALANLYSTVHSLEPHQIAVIIDGDDYLTGPEAFETIASEYQDPDCWMTYGNFKSDPFIAGRHSEDVSKIRNVRQYPLWITHHPISFYAALFQKIQKKDLLYKGKFFQMAGDLAFGFPLFEMAGTKHFRFISKILYAHNLINPISDFRKDDQLQMDLSAIVRKRAPYAPLLTLFESITDGSKKCKSHTR